MSGQKQTILRPYFSSIQRTAADVSRPPEYASTTFRVMRPYTSSQDAAQKQLAEIAVGLEARHARNIEDLVERQGAVDPRQQERRTRADRRRAKLVERPRQARDTLEVAEEHL